MSEVPENVEGGGEPTAEPGAPGPEEGPRRHGDRLGSGYIAQLQPLPVWPEVLSRLTRGDSALSVVTWLVNDQRFECTSVRALAGALTAYRRRLPQAAVTPPAVLPGFAGQDGAPPRTGESLLREIQWAIKQQIDRIRKARKTEKGFPMAHPQVTQDLELLRRMTETRANLAMRLGLAKEVPQQFDVRSLGIHAHLMAVPADVRHRAVEIVRQAVRQARHGTPAAPRGGDGKDGHDGDAA